MNGKRYYLWRIRAMVGVGLAAGALMGVAALPSGASADGAPAATLNARPSCDTDGDGKADVWLTDQGFAVDIGQGHILIYQSKAAGIKQTARNQCIVLFDSDGNGTIDTQLTLTDKNGDGDFGDAGELTRSPYPASVAR